MHLVLRQLRELKKDMKYHTDWCCSEFPKHHQEKEEVRRGTKRTGNSGDTSTHGEEVDRNSQLRSRSSFPFISPFLDTKDLYNITSSLLTTRRPVLDPYVSIHHEVLDRCSSAAVFMLQVAACNTERSCGAACVHKVFVPSSLDFLMVTLSSF